MALNGRQSTLLCLFTFQSIDDPSVDPCQALLQDMRARGSRREAVASVRRDIRPLREAVQEMREILSRLRRRGRHPERLSGPERRVAELRRSLPQDFDAAGHPRSRLAPARQLALGMIAWAIGQRTAQERRRA